MVAPSMAARRDTLAGGRADSTLRAAWATEARLAEPPIADNDASALEFGLDADPFDVPLESDGVLGEFMLDVEHLAGLHQHPVVGEPIADLVGGGAVGIPADDRAQPPQVGSETARSGCRADGAAPERHADGRPAPGA